MQQDSDIAAGDAAAHQHPDVGEHAHALALVLEPGRSVTRESLVQRVEERIHLLPRYRQRLEQPALGLANPVWVDDPDFDLEYHVRHIALPKPGDWRQFCIQASRIHARPLDRNRPLWEIYVIEGLDSLLDEAYLAHRFVEEVNDLYIKHFGQPLIPLDMTVANLIAHQLIGEEFANQLDEAVHHAVDEMLNDESFALESVEAYREKLSSPDTGAAWKRWPCMSRRLGVGLELDQPAA